MSPARGRSQEEGDRSQSQELKSQRFQSEIFILIFQLLIPPLFLFRVKVLYDYEAQDLDELTIKEGELIDLLKEGRRQHFFKIFSALL